MSPEAPPNAFAGVENYASLWGECTARALGQLQGATFTAARQPSAPVPAASEPVVPAAPAEPAAAVPAEVLSLRFKVSGRLVGEQLFNVSKADGVRLAQMLMAEPLDPTAAFSEGYADALNEIFRQFAGLASTACKAKYGAEVRFNLESVTAAEWKPASTAIWSFTAPQVAPIQWTLLLSPELLKAVDAAHEATLPAPSAQPVAPEATAPGAPLSPPAASPTTPTQPVPNVGPSVAAKVASPTAPSPAPSPPQPAFVKPTPPPAPKATGVALEGNASNLDLLLDVVLEATLRFGQREMLLRDILELHPGSVVELDRRIQEPAELLVAGRVIAHGDVVIVDGSYGLRITDVAQPQHRLESVEV